MFIPDSNKIKNAFVFQEWQKGQAAKLHFQERETRSCSRRHYCRTSQ